MLLLSMGESEFVNPKLKIPGWPYTSDQEFGAYPVRIKQEDQRLIVKIVLDEYVVLPASQIFFMHNRSFLGIENQEGYLIKVGRDLNNEVQLWWVPLSSEVKFDVYWDSLELIALEPGQLRTGRLYRIITTVDSRFYEVYYDNSEGRWYISSEIEEIKTGALVVPKGYYFESESLYPRIFVWYSGDMKMFAMSRSPKLVPDFKGRVPAFYRRLRIPDSIEKV